MVLALNLSILDAGIFIMVHQVEIDDVLAEHGGLYSCLLLLRPSSY